MSECIHGTDPDEECKDCEIYLLKEELKIKDKLYSFTYDISQKVESQSQEIADLKAELKIAYERTGNSADKAVEYSRQVTQMQEVIEAVAHIGIDFGYGKYELQPDVIDKARSLTNQEG